MTKEKLCDSVTTHFALPISYVDVKVDLVFRGNWRFGFPRLAQIG